MLGSCRPNSRLEVNQDQGRDQGVGIKIRIKIKAQSTYNGALCLIQCYRSQRYAMPPHGHTHSVWSQHLGRG